ncbi:hypothetical protein [Prescottella equi]|uniref:hypothetical protein n=1 Tax=Rhodococcus hoagii TaxID=43767 RepID=UPI001F35197A|nr:hypothetical protein [Prescottella equi]
MHLAEEVGGHARRLRGAVADQALLDELEESAAAVAITCPAVGNVLLHDCLEAGPETCIVLATSKPAQAGIQQWLNVHGVPVLTASELERVQAGRDQAYVVGPPRFYRSSVVTAPATNGVSFLLPAWFQDRGVPRSAIATYADGAIRIRAKVFTEGDTTMPAGAVPTEVDDEDIYLPQPIWGARQSEYREPTSEEVVAHKVLLGGGLAMWLDDGERIRSLDPDQPAGERVTYTDIATVRQGTYLLLRQGATERSALYQAAIAKLGPRGGAVDASQTAWKRRLAKTIELLGDRKVVRDLKAAGVKTAERARAWTDPNLIRPNNDQDFERLLQWLGVPVHPSFGHAAELRKALYRVSADVGRQLEAAVSTAELSVLETTGYLSLDVKAEGFRGILATRVLAISPHPEIVLRHDARVPFKDRSGKWLE